MAEYEPEFSVIFSPDDEETPSPFVSVTSLGDVFFLPFFDFCLSVITALALKAAPD